MARVLRIRPHLADPSGLHEDIYLSHEGLRTVRNVCVWNWPEVFSIQTGNILPACETRLGGTCPRATCEILQPYTILKGEKFTSSSYNAISYCLPIIYIQLKKKIILAKFAKYNNLFSPFLDRRTRVESKISQDSLTFYEGKKFYLNDSTYVSPRFHTRNQKLNIK